MLTRAQSERKTIVGESDKSKREGFERTIPAECMQERDRIKEKGRVERESNVHTSSHSQYTHNSAGARHSIYLSFFCLALEIRSE